MVSCFIYINILLQIILCYYFYTTKNMSTALWFKISEYLENLTGIKGILAYVLIISTMMIGYSWTTAAIFPSDSIQNSEHVKKVVSTNANKNVDSSTTGRHHGDDDDDKPDPPRNFTSEQLLQYDGTKDEKNNEDKPVYLSMNGIVFDVTQGRNFYGPGGPYEKFAGHECGIALAKMSFDTEFLDDLDGCKTKLNFGERTELDNWIEKFRDYRNYPILGRLVVNLPDPTRIISTDELRKYDGTSDDIPEGYATAPIYIGANDKVYDMSFGGVTFYGPGGPYHKFAGHDASRALALMSLDIKDVENASIADCTEKQLTVMKDWIKTFEERKKYPVVGRLRK